MARYENREDQYTNILKDTQDVRTPIDLDNASTMNENGSVAQKMEIMVLTNGWNDKNERMIISIGENAASYKWMHEKSSSLYKLMHQIFAILLIVFSTGLSAGTVLPLTVKEDNPALNITRQIFTYIVTVISVLQNFLKLETLGEQHIVSSSEFGKLYYDIQQQMCMYRRDRKNATSYLSDILIRYDNLIVNGPTITSYTISQFKNTFRNSNISVPDIADSIQKIEIVTESDPSSIVAPKSKSLGVIPNPTSNVKTNYSKNGLCNLQQIHSAFQIQGDISDQDVAGADVMELREIRRRHLDNKTQYEFERFRQHD